MCAICCPEAQWLRHLFQLLQVKALDSEAVEACPAIALLTAC